MQKYEMKKLCNKRIIIIELLFYLIISMVCFIRFAFQNPKLSKNIQYGDFIDIENMYMTLLIVWVCIIVSDFFAMEYRTGMMQIILVTRNGRKTFTNSKIKTALLLSNGLYIIYFIVVIFGWIRAFGFHFDMPLVEQAYFVGYMKSHIINDMGDVLRVNLAGTFISVNLTALVCLYLSNRFPNPFMAMSVFITVSFITGLCSGLGGIGVISTLSPIVFLHVDEAFMWEIDVLGHYIGFFFFDIILFITAIVYTLYKLRKMFLIK